MTFTSITEHIVLAKRTDIVAATRISDCNIVLNPLINTSFMKYVFTSAKALANAKS